MKQLLLFQSEWESEDRQIVTALVGPFFPTAFDAEICNVLPDFRFKHSPFSLTDNMRQIQKTTLFDVMLTCQLNYYLGTLLINCFLCPLVRNNGCGPSIIISKPNCRICLLHLMCHKDVNYKIYNAFEKEYLLLWILHSCAHISICSISTLADTKWCTYQCQLYKSCCQCQLFLSVSVLWKWNGYLSRLPLLTLIVRTVMQLWIHLFPVL